MSETIDIAEGGFRSLPLVPQFSAGVAALPGHSLRRVRFERPVPLADGFARIRSHLEAAGRPPTAFAACELRSPEPFTEAGFEAFNRIYLRGLDEWGVMRGGVNPVARTNVCPSVRPPETPSFHAFSYTVEEARGPSGFVIAGSCEVPENQPGEYTSHIVRYGETGPDAICEKARFVLGELERRLALLGGSWNEVTGTHVYTTRELGPALLDEIVRRGAAPHGLAWNPHRPPVVGLEFEMDCRRVPVEGILPVDGTLP